MSGALAGSALADENRPGLAFKAATSGGVPCFQKSNFGALRNTCEASQMAVATLPNLPAGAHPTSVFVFGSNRWCQSMTTDKRGFVVDSGLIAAAAARTTDLAKPRYR